MRSPLRAILIGAALTAAACPWGFYAFHVALASSWTGSSLMRGPLFVLFALVIANLALRALRPRLRLDQRELLIIYVMLTMGAGVNGSGMLAYLVPAIASVYDHPGIYGMTMFVPYAPQHLVISDPQVIAGFHNGHSSVWQPRVLETWAGPIAWWSAFIYAFIFAVLCVQVLLCKQWLQRERLVFPLAQIPLALTERAGAGLKGNRLFWLGFGLVVALEAVNGLAYYFPAMPHLPVQQVRWGQQKLGWPWASMSDIFISYNPFLISIAYFVNLDVSLSVWLFFLIFRALEYEFAVHNLRGIVIGGGLAGYPLLGEQGIGAFIGLAGVTVWTARGSLAEVARSAWHGWRRDEGAMFSHRTAILGALAAAGFMLWFMVKMGLVLMLAIPVLLIMLIYALILSRVVAEAGYGYFVPENGAAETVLYAAGTRNLPIRPQVALGLMSSVDQFYSDNPSPQQINSMKLAEASGTPMRHMLWAVLLGAAVGLAAGWLSQLDVYYKYGAATAHMRESWQRTGRRGFLLVKNFYDLRTGTDWMMLQGVGLGMGIITLLVKLRAAFYWFPLHPAGYLMAGTPAAKFIWVPFLLGWAIKSAVVRYSGLPLYRRLIPFFLGMIAGDIVVPAVFSIYGAISGQPTYQFFP